MSDSARWLTPVRHGAAISVRIATRQLVVAGLSVVVASVATACTGSGTVRWTYQPAATPTVSPSGAPSAASTAAASAGATAPASAAAGQSIVLSEWKVDMPATLKAGQADFTISNAGTIQHELLVFKSNLDPSAYPKDSAGDIDEEGPGINLISDGDNLDVGGTQPRSVDLSKPGKYLFVCNIPGHFQQGMFTLVTVK